MQLLLVYRSTMGKVEYKFRFYEKSQRCYKDETELNLSETARQCHLVDEPLKTQAFLNRRVVSIDQR